LISSLVLSAGLLTACGGGDQTSSPSAPATTGAQSPVIQTPTSAPGSASAQPAGDIVIAGFAFTMPAAVKPGQQVTVVNKDDASHSVTADANNLFDVRVSGGGGFTTFTAPTTPGTYPFHCKYHAGMRGSLVVQTE